MRERERDLSDMLREILRETKNFQSKWVTFYEFGEVGKTEETLFTGNIEIGDPTWVVLTPSLKTGI